MSGFGYPDRFISTLSGPQYNPSLYGDQIIKSIPESENKELKSEQDKLINTSGALMKAYENMTNKSKVHCPSGSVGNE